MQTNRLFARFAQPSNNALGHAALALRVGLGSVFIIGGLAKLSRLLSPSLADGIVTQYMGPLGYINETFQQLLFASWLGGLLSPWSFLTVLSAFELVAGIMLVAGLLVRPLALVWSLLLWSFVFSLPVVTTPGVIPAETTYGSPALLVQVRDVSLSGLFVALYLLGPGTRSLDAGVFGLPQSGTREWAGVAALVRLSLALTFIVAGVFHGFHKIPTFDAPAIALVVVGLGLAAGMGTRVFAAGAVVVLVAYMAGKGADATSVLGFFNAVKREFALLAAAGVLAVYGGGHVFTLHSIARDVLEGARRYLRRPAAATR